MLTASTQEAGAARNQDWDEFEEYLDTELADKVEAWSPQFQYIDWQNEGVQYRGQKLTMIPATPICISAIKITAR